jgi:hypothetical protein
MYRFTTSILITFALICVAGCASEADVEAWRTITTEQRAEVEEEGSAFNKTSATLGQGAQCPSTATPAASLITFPNTYPWTLFQQYGPSRRPATHPLAVRSYSSSPAFCALGVDQRHTSRANRMPHAGTVNSQ